MTTPVYPNSENTFQAPPSNAADPPGVALFEMIGNIRAAVLELRNEIDELRKEVTKIKEGGPR